MKYLFTLIGLLFITNINSQCIAGDCENGFGIKKGEKGTITRAFFKNGKRSGFGMLFDEGLKLITYIDSDNRAPISIMLMSKSGTISIMHKEKGESIIAMDQLNIYTQTFYDEPFSSNKSSKNDLSSNGVSTGCIRGNCKSGFGVYVYDEGQKYIGTYSNGKFNGYGAYILADGRAYYGEFRNSTMHGKGIFIWNDNKYYMGEWNNGKMQGKGVLQTKARKFTAGYFENNKIVETINTEESQNNSNVNNINVNNNNNNDNNNDVIEDNVGLGDVGNTLIKQIKTCDDISCLASLYNRMAKVLTGDKFKSKPKMAKKVMVFILRHMDRKTDGVLFDVYMKSDKTYQKFFLSCVKMLPKNLREEMVNKANNYGK